MSWEIKAVQDSETEITALYLSEHTFSGQLWIKSAGKLLSNRTGPGGVLDFFSLTVIIWDIRSSRGASFIKIWITLDNLVSYSASKGGGEWAAL